MSAYSLDTDIITKLLKKHPGNRPVVDRFRLENMLEHAYTRVRSWT